MKLKELKELGYILKPTKYGWVVINTNGKDDNHSHFTAYKESERKNCRINCIVCAKLVIKKQIPKSDYMLIACRRLTNDSEYKNELIKVLEEIENKKKMNHIKKLIKILEVIRADLERV